MVFRHEHLPERVRAKLDHAPPVFDEVRIRLAVQPRLVERLDKIMMGVWRDESKRRLGRSDVVETSKKFSWAFRRGRNLQEIFLDVSTR